MRGGCVVWTYLHSCRHSTYFFINSCQWINGCYLNSSRLLLFLSSIMHEKTISSYIVLFINQLCWCYTVICQLCQDSRMWGVGCGVAPMPAQLVDYTITYCRNLCIIFTILNSKVSLISTLRSICCNTEHFLVPFFIYKQYFIYITFIKITKKNIRTQMES